MDITDGIGAPGSIETFILMGLGAATDTGGGTGQPGAGDFVLANTGMSGTSGGNEDVEMG